MDQAKPHANDGASEPNGKPAAECAPGTLDGASLVVESGFESLQGIRKTMEDAHVALDDLLTSFPHLSSLHPSPPFAFYAVYDGKSINLPPCVVSTQNPFSLTPLCRTTARTCRRGGSCSRSRFGARRDHQRGSLCRGTSRGGPAGRFPQGGCAHLGEKCTRWMEEWHYRSRWVCALPYSLCCQRRRF